MKNSINWFEIPATDIQRGARFYSEVLGIPVHAEEFQGASMAILGTEQGGVTGALVAGQSYEPCHKGVRIYLNGGDDLAGPLSRVEAAGGKLLVPKTKVSDEIGYYAVFEDTEGNAVALHSPH